MTELRSGMHLPPTEERVALDTVVKEAYSERYTSFGRHEGIVAANKIYDSIGDFEGVELLEAADCGNDYDFRCAEYALGRRLGINWANDPDNNMIGFWTNTEAHLQEEGFNLVEAPEAGALAAYFEFGFWEDKTIPQYYHFGIVEQGDKITSKFGMGGVATHEVDMIPLQFGTHVNFFDKAD